MPWQLRKNIIANVCYWLWDMHWNNLATDQSLHQWSSAGCWPRFNQMLLQLIDVPHWFLINMFLYVVSPRAMHWCGSQAVRDESEYRILLWCLAAQTVAARHLSSCWRVLLSSAPRVRKNTRAAATQDSGLHTRRGLPTDQTLLYTLQIIESHWGMRLLETARDVKHRWWAVVINRMTFY